MGWGKGKDKMRELKQARSVRRMGKSLAVNKMEKKMRFNNKGNVPHSINTFTHKLLS